MSQIGQGKGEKRSNGNGKTESENIDEETMKAFARILQDFGSVSSIPPAPTPAPTFLLLPRLPTILQFIERASDLSALRSALQRVGGFDVEFRPTFNGTFPFPSGRRKLQFQLSNPFRINDISSFLDGPGSFTFFAPTNAGFNSVPPALLETLFTNDEFLPHLEDLLLYHGLEGGRFTSQFGNGARITTLNTERVGFRTLDGILRVNRNVPVVEPNIELSNGIVHKVEGVLAPGWVSNTVLRSLMVRTDLSVSIMLELLVLAGLDETLNSEQGSGFTVLAPTNFAFSLLNGAVDLPFLRNPANEARLDRILGYHIIVDKVYTTPRLIDGANLATASGNDVVVSVVDENVMLDPVFMFNQATATSESILANNGVLYEISAFLNPDRVGGF
jgi:uncharacterized surface protein with fasciclin (FAS1) repeats